MFCCMRMLSISIEPIESKENMTTSSKAVRIDKHGGPEEIKIVDVDVGEPGPGQIRIRHKAVGLNFIDIYRLRQHASRQLLRTARHARDVCLQAARCYFIRDGRRHDAQGPDRAVPAA